MMHNEKTLRSENDIEDELFNIWQVMKACIERGMRTEGILPGGLKVKRRAPNLHLKLNVEITNDPLRAMDWVDLFALAVNEEKRRRRACCNRAYQWRSGYFTSSTYVLSYFYKRS